MQLKFIFIFLIIVNGCANRETRVKISKRNAFTPKVSTDIQPITLQEMHFETGRCYLLLEPKKKVHCITEDNLKKDIENINTIRKAYNELLLRYKTDISYYEDIMNVK